MGLPKKLTEMQMKFAYEIVTNEGRKTATECAIDAGYDKDSAVVRASELQNPKRYPLVVQYIGELRAEYQKKYDVTFERHITELAKLRDESRGKGAWSAAINAEVARGKAAGLYVEQKIIRTGKLEDLSADELENRLKEIMEDYKPLLEGVEVQDLEDDVKSRQKKIRLGKPQQPKKKDVVEVNYSSSSSSESSSSSSDQSSGPSESA
jgi:phage terminase small subunit